MRDKSKLMSEPGETILEVRFIGETLALHGIPIYELGTALVSIQRMVNKAHLVREHRWKYGSSPARGEREMLALQIGARRRGSDWFGLVLLFADPMALSAIRRAVDYVMSGLRIHAETTPVGCRNQARMAVAAPIRQRRGADTGKQQESGTCSCADPNVLRSWHCPGQGQI